MFRLLRPPRKLIPIAKFSTAAPLLAKPRYKRFGDSPSSSTSSITALLPIPFKENRYFKQFSRNPPYLIIAIGSGSFLYYITHLERVELSENSRLRFIDTSIETERAMGEQGLRDILNQYKGRILPPNDRRTIYVTGIAEKLISRNDLRRDGTQWNVFVIEDNTKNAFVLPGGHIFVFTGILPITKDSDGLAVVLGHELAHQVARHSAERVSSLKVLFALSLVLSSLGIDFGFSRMILNFCMTLPNSRTAETEADYIGLKLSTKACYDPAAAKGVWQRMQSAENGSAPQEFLSTHPSSGNRIVKVDRWAQDIIRDRPEHCGGLEREISQFWRNITALLPIPFKENRYFKQFSRNPPYLIIAIGSGSVLYYVTHLERVELSEHSRLRFIDTSIETERAMGEQGLRDILNQYKGRILPPNDRRTIYVKGIAEKLISRNDLRRDGTQWNVFVIEDNTKNAFVLPGGHIFVFTGILPITKDSDGLAVVLGHELAHQVARHSAERVSSLKVLFALSLVLSSLGIDFGFSRMILNFCMTLPNSRTAETEVELLLCSFLSESILKSAETNSFLADYIGLKLSTKACYDPAAAKGAWQRMQSAENGSAPPEFLSTHPSSGNRIVKVDRWAQDIIRDRPEHCGGLEREISQFWRK